MSRVVRPALSASSASSALSASPRWLARLTLLFLLTGCSASRPRTETPTPTDVPLVPTATATLTPQPTATPTVPLDIFADDYFPAYELEIPPASWQALQADPRTYVPATFRHNGQTWTPIGVKLKGRWGSYRDLHGKSSFTLKFDEYVSTMTFRGHKALVLNNGAQDTSLIHERCAYLVFRSLGVVASRCNNCTLRVNGANWGVMVQLERVREQFLAANFSDGSGNLYEGDPYDAFLPAIAGGWPPNYGAVQWDKLDDIIPGHEANFDLHTNEAQNNRADLAAFAALLESAQPGQLMAATASKLDWDQFFRYFAAEALCSHWDGYCFWIPNNYYLYHQPTTGKFHFLPWGMDGTCGPLPFFMNIQNMVGSSVLSVAVVRDGPAWAAFKQRLSDSLGTFIGLNMSSRVLTYAAQIRQSVYDDPRKEYTNQQWEMAVARTQAWAWTQPTWIASQLP